MYPGKKKRKSWAGFDIIWNSPAEDLLSEVKVFRRKFRDTTTKHGKSAPNETEKGRGVARGGLKILASRHYKGPQFSGASERSPVF